MDIKQLKYFIEIANAKTLSQAAKNIFVSQPTLSLALKKMEEELKTSLFYTDNKSYVLTQSGEKLYNRGSLIVESFDNLVNEIQQEREKNDYATIRVGLTILFAVQFMNHISNFITSHSNVNLSIIQGGSSKLQTMLANDEIDVALVSFPNLESQDITIENLPNKGYNISVVMKDCNPLSNYTSLCFDDLKHQRFSTLTQDFMIGKLLTHESEKYNFKPDIVFAHSDLQVLLYSLEKFDSICLLPIEYKPIGEVSGLKWIPLDNQKSHFPIGIAVNHNIEKNKYIDSFIEEIKKSTI